MADLTMCPDCGTVCGNDWHARDRLAAVTDDRTILLRDVADLRAHLAEVEAERDELLGSADALAMDAATQRARLAAVEARLAAAWQEGWDARDEGCPGGYVLRPEDDQNPYRAEQMLADVQREHAAAWADQNRPNLGPVQCNHSPEWHAGLTWCRNCQPRCAANGCTNRATSTRKSAVPGWPDELACGQHGGEGRADG